MNVRFNCKHCDEIRCAIKEKCKGFTNGSIQCDMDENVSESESEFESQLWSSRYATEKKPLKMYGNYIKIILKIFFILLRDRTDNNEETEVRHEDNFLIEETLRPAS